MIYKYYINTGQFINYNLLGGIHTFSKITPFGQIPVFSKITTFVKKPHFFGQIPVFQKSQLLSKITTFGQITVFQKSQLLSKITTFGQITVFQKSQLLSKITTFGQITNFGQKSRLLHTFTEFRAFSKLPCFLENSPFKVHFGIPRLTTCKKSRFSVQDLGFRL